MISASENFVTLELSDGSVRNAPVPLFESLHRLQQSELTFWPKPAQLAPVEIDQFTAKFPMIQVNDEELQLPPIHFKRDPGGQLNMILNCWGANTLALPSQRKSPWS